MASYSYGYTGGVQTFTVQTTGTYDITGYGAQGGSFAGAVGGKGAEVGGYFHLTAGERIEIVVGGAGEDGGGAGGGGGSFVLASTDTGASYHLVLAAGGGGGAFISDGDPGHASTAGTGWVLR